MARGDDNLAREAAAFNLTPEKPKELYLWVEHKPAFNFACELITTRTGFVWLDGCIIGIDWVQGEAMMRILDIPKSERRGIYDRVNIICGEFRKHVNDIVTARRRAKRAR